MNSNLSRYYILAAAVLVTLSVIILSLRTTNQVELAAGDANQINGSETRVVRFLEKGRFPSFVSGVMEPGNIRLELSPEGFKDGRLTVRFFANAHDQTLDPYDLKLMSTLDYGDLRLKPTYSDRMKGHHDSGLMFFDFGKLHDPSSLSTFSITVVGLPSEDVRVFKWE